MLSRHRYRPGTYTWEICERCRGHGTHWPEAFDNGFSHEDLAEWEPDEREDLMAGAYDVPCKDCQGGRVQVPIISAMTFAEKRVLAEERRHARWAAESAAEQRAEMRMMGEY